MPSATHVSCDTSVLVPALLEWHPLHPRAREVVRDRVTSLPAQVYAEAFSTLTRLRDPRRPTPAQARDALRGLRRRVLALPAGALLELVDSLADARLGGGATYDAIVAATAKHHHTTLLSADQRAQSTYHAVGVRYELLDLVR